MDIHPHSRTNVDTHVMMNSLVITSINRMFSSRSKAGVTNLPRYSLAYTQPLRGMGVLENRL